MTDDLADRFARQDDPSLLPSPGFGLVRVRAAQIERRQRQRRRLVLIAAVLAVLLAVPAVAVSRALVDHFFGKPADATLDDYIGLVLKAGPGTAFATPPRYVAGVRTSRGFVLVWSARRSDGTQCSGVQAAFGDSDIARLKLAGRTIADNGINCGGEPSPVDANDVGLSTGQGLGGVHVFYGQVPARVRAVRVTFEDARAETVAPRGGWVIVAFEHATERPGHRPLLEQALGAHGRALASVHLNPWNFGGTESPPPPLDGPGSRLLETVATPAGPVALRLSAPGRGWQLRQCVGVAVGGHFTPILCDYPAAVQPSATRQRTNLFLYGPHFDGFVIAVARAVDRAWLVADDDSIRPTRVARFSLAGLPEGIVVATTRQGRKALAGLVGSRGRRIVAALVIGEHEAATGGVTGPCFLEAGGAGAPPPTPACLAVMQAARPAVASGSP